MNFGPKFSLMIRRTPVLVLSLNEPVLAEAVPSTGEQDSCAFNIPDPEQNTEYRILMGDEQPQDTTGEDFGHVISWKHATYFESARGRVPICVLSKRLGSPGACQERVRCAVNVLPTKLGEERYEAMFEDLRTLSVCLVFDLISKSRLGFELHGLGGLSLRPANAELVLVISRMAGLDAESAARVGGTRPTRRWRPSSKSPSPPSADRATGGEGSATSLAPNCEARGTGPTTKTLPESRQVGGLSNRVWGAADISHIALYDGIPLHALNNRQ